MQHVQIAPTGDLGPRLLRRAFAAVAAVLPLIAGAAPGAFAQPFRVASFNVHYIVPSDPDESWSRRKQAVTRVLQEMDADIVAFQEMETFEGGAYNERNLQLDWVLRTVPGYRAAAHGNPRVFPTTQPILYKPSRFALLAQGFFFFSDSPDAIYSPQWDGGYPYFCSWAKLRALDSGEEIHVFNVHNDYQSRSNRLASSRLIADRMRRIVPAGGSIIVVGDFNAPRWFDELEILERAGLEVVAPNGGTHRILGMRPLPAIDHILVTEDLRAHAPIRVWNARYDGIYPSDHTPISVDLSVR